MGKTVCLARAALAYSMEGELSETLLSDLPVQQPLVEEKPRSKWSIKCDKSLWLNMLYISAFSYLGVMARKACEKLCEDEQSGEDVWQLPVVYQIFFGSTVFGGHAFFLANVLGCVVMGLMSKVQTLVTSSGTHGPYLYVGITTGFCGCLTTFATWNQNLSQAASRSSTYDSRTEQEVPFSANFNTMHWFDAYFLLLIEFMLFYGSFILGQILGDGLYAIVNRCKESEADKLGRRSLRLRTSSMLHGLRQGSSLPADMARTGNWPAELLPETQIEGYLAASAAAADQAASAAARERLANEAPVRKENHVHIFVALGAFLGLSALSWLLASSWRYSSEGDFWKSTGRSMVFAPAGALLRYLFSLYNKKMRSCEGIYDDSECACLRDRRCYLFSHRQCMVDRLWHWLQWISVHSQHFRERMLKYAPHMENGVCWAELRDCSTRLLAD